MSFSCVNYKDKQLFDGIVELYFRKEVDEKSKKMLKEVAMEFARWLS